MPCQSGGGARGRLEEAGEAVVRLFRKVGENVAREALAELGEVVVERAEELVPVVELVRLRHGLVGIARVADHPFGEDQVRYALGMLERVEDRHRGALGEAVQGHLLGADRRAHGLDVRNLVGDGERRRAAV